MKTTLKTSKLLKACVWALLLLAGLHLGGIKTLAAARPSCEKTKTVYYQKQNFKNPQTQERYVVYDFLGTNEISLQNVSSKAVVSNLKSSNSHISVYYNSVTKKISLDLNYTAKTLKNGEKAVISFNVKQNKKSYRLSCTVTFRPDFVKSAKIGKLDITRKLNRSQYAGYLKMTTTQKKARIKFTLPSDYKIVSIRYNYKGEEVGPVWNTAKKVKNGGTLVIKKNTVLCVEYAAKKGKSIYNRSYIISINCK